MWKFCGKGQFPHSFRRFARNYAETVPFRKISTPGNQVKLRYFSQKHLSRPLLVFINDLLLLLAQHNRYSFFYRKVSTLSTVSILIVYCVHGVYIVGHDILLIYVSCYCNSYQFTLILIFWFENKFLQFNLVQFNCFNSIW